MFSHHISNNHIHDFLNDKIKPAANSGLAPLWGLGFFGRLIVKIKFVYICDVLLLNATTASQATGRCRQSLHPVQ